MGESLKTFVVQHDAILMANHGAVAYGKSLAEAYMKMEVVEHCARIALVTKLLGGNSNLKKEQFERLLSEHELRARSALYTA